MDEFPFRAARRYNINKQTCFQRDNSNGNRSVFIMNYGVFIVYPYTEKSLTRFGTGNPSPTVKYGKIKPTILNIRISAQIFLYFIGDQYYLLVEIPWQYAAKLFTFIFFCGIIKNQSIDPRQFRIYHKGRQNEKGLELQCT